MNTRQIFERELQASRAMADRARNLQKKIDAAKSDIDQSVMRQDLLSAAHEAIEAMAVTLDMLESFAESQAPYHEFWDGDWHNENQKALRNLSRYRELKKEITNDRQNARRV